MGDAELKFTGGLPETACGAGSTLETTAHLRSKLPALLKSLSVRRLLDAPCGDFNWMAHTELSGLNYVGCDLHAEHLERAHVNAAAMVSGRPQTLTFVRRDIVWDWLPRADLMICRDFVQHLPHAVVDDVIHNFIASQIPWLLATSFDNAENEDIERPGQFRPLNLRAPPFAFPSPVAAIADPPGSGRILGLWHTDRIA